MTDTCGTVARNFGSLLFLITLLGYMDLQLPFLLPHLLLAGPVNDIIISSVVTSHYSLLTLNKILSSTTWK